MGSGDKNPKNFHLPLPLPLPHHKANKYVTKDVPRGYMAIKVGLGEEPQRFVVPVIYFNHPRFVRLLKEAEDEYGFDQKGTIIIPCLVEEFRRVQAMIDHERSFPPQHQSHNYLCFKA